MKGLKVVSSILLIEDDFKLKEYISEYLKVYDYEVIQESADNRVGKIGTLKAITKIIKSIKVGEIKDILCYQS